MDTSAPPSAVIACMIAFPDEQTAARIGRALVEERLAACVNLIPGVRSLYRWQGAVCDESEVLAVVKTTIERLVALRARVLQLHPYEVPEVIALPIVDGHGPYLDWVRAAIAESG